jgi:hypothetical protein
MSNFNVQGHIPSTGGDALTGAKLIEGAAASLPAWGSLSFGCKTRQGEKRKGKGQTERKKLQQYSRIDYNNNYGHG